MHSVLEGHSVLLRVVVNKLWIEFKMVTGFLLILFIINQLRTNKSQTIALRTKWTPKTSISSNGLCTMSVNSFSPTSSQK